MLIQEYLKDNTLEDLENEFGIKNRLYDDRVVLNYSQIDSPKNDPIVRECRGLILSIPDFKILSRTFDRFYNYGEDQESKNFDILNSYIDEKVDGSLCPVYHDGEKWQVATRGTAYAEGEVNKSNKTFREIFIKTIGGDPNDIFHDVNKDYTIIFELVSPESRVVKPYQEACVYLIEIRNKKTGDFIGVEESFNWDMPDCVKWKYPEQFGFKTWDNIFHSMEKLSAMDEGYVAICKNTPANHNSNKWRLKVKNPSYLAIANLRLNGLINEKRIILLVLMNDQAEYLQYFPEDQKEFDPYIKAYQDMKNEIYDLWFKYKDIENQKEFALSIRLSGKKYII